MPDYHICKRIETETDDWQDAVTSGRPSRVAEQFCDDGILLGTVSQTIRRGKEIESYFDYFAKLPDIQVLERRDDVSSVTDDVAINNSMVTWQWDGTDPVQARMTFVYRREKGDDRNWCLFELHSSVLPPVNQDLRSVHN